MRFSTARVDPEGVGFQFKGISEVGHGERSIINQYWLHENLNAELARPCALGLQEFRKHQQACFFQSNFMCNIILAE